MAADGRVVWLRDLVHLVRKGKGLVRQLRGVMVDITRQKLKELELTTRAAQESAVAGLGQRALSGVELSAFMGEAATLVTRTLGVEFCEINELLHDGTDLLLRAGEGWEPGLVGHATVSAGGNSHAWFTLLSMEPVVIEDVATETRFNLPEQHRAHGIVCGVTVAIGRRDRPYGVLGAFSSQPRVFTRNDITFLQAVSNLVAISVERRGTEQPPSHP
jgi:GAF domain-containing protein